MLLCTSSQASSLTAGPSRLASTKRASTHLASRQHTLSTAGPNLAEYKSKKRKEPSTETKVNMDWTGQTDTCMWDTNQALPDKLPIPKVKYPPEEEEIAANLYYGTFTNLILTHRTFIHVLCHKIM